MCLPGLSLIACLCFYWSGLSPCEKHSRSPPLCSYQQQWLPSVCVCVVLSPCLLFILKSCSVAEQKATSQSPPLRVGIVVLLSACTSSGRRGSCGSVLSSSISVCCHILCFQIKINMVVLKVTVSLHDLLLVTWVSLEQRLSGSLVKTWWCCISHLLLYH